MTICIITVFQDDQTSMREDLFSFQFGDGIGLQWILGSHMIPSSLLVPSMPDRSSIICVKCSGRCDTEAGVYTSSRYVQCKAKMSEVFTLLCCRSLSSFTELRFQCPYQPWAEKPNRKPDYFSGLLPNNGRENWILCSTPCKKSVVKIYNTVFYYPFLFKFHQ